MQITFERDGKVRVFVMQDGDHLSCSTDANRLSAMLPADTMIALQGAVAELHETLQETVPQQLKIVGGR
jgi:hypothetical protein|tara:strand:- start:577 stop:783 length:207 start_codon:yes stop_codon:yes gene_type:complete